MRYFPDEPARGMWARYGIAVLPLLFLIVALLYSASSAPWGRQVDPEATYAMNGIAWAADGLMRKNDHPGTMTILLVGLVVKLWAFLAGSSDIIEFGLKNYDGVIYASRAAEALVLAGVLLASGVIVRNVTRSAFAAMLFQVAPFVHPEGLHFEVMLIPESLMVSFAILGMALVLKAALDEKQPSIGLGAAQGLVFALGVSSKYLHFPLAVLGVSLFRKRWAYPLACMVAVFSFLVLNRILNPMVFSLGWEWLVRLATHKGMYGTGEAGFIDFKEFWTNMAAIIMAAPVVSAVFAMGALAALARMVTSRRLLDPISLTLNAFFLAFAAQLVATSKHFALHYMLASWVLTGGVLVLILVEVRRLFPSISPQLVAGAAMLVCATLIVPTLVEIRRDARQQIALNNIGAKLGQAVVTAGPSCANVSTMFARAPENDLSFGADTTLSTVKMAEQYSEVYQRAFKVPLLDHSSYLLGQLRKNFLPFSYPQLAAEYPCIVVRTYRELDAVTSLGLLELNPDYCLVDGIHVYAVGIACEKIRSAYAS
jgi:uncharacterized membrane protein